MADWGPIRKAVTDGKTVAGEEGTVTQPHVSGSDAPRHEVDYDATDGRHNRESGMGPWRSIDSQSGICSDTNWETPHSRFPDGPGIWRQT